MRSQMMRVISSPSSSTTGFATLIFVMEFVLHLSGHLSGTCRESGGLLAIEPHSVKGSVTKRKIVPDSYVRTARRTRHHPLRTAIGREHRRLCAGDGEFRSLRFAPRQAARRLAEPESGSDGRG